MMLTIIDVNFHGCFVDHAIKVDLPRESHEDYVEGVSRSNASENMDTDAALKRLELDCQLHGICISYQHQRGRQNASAGTVLQRCLTQVNQFRNRMGKQLCVYKLGLTSKPILRYQFYKEANYSHMTILHVSTNLGLIQMLEAALIAAHVSEKGCRNQKYGGEGPPGSISEPFHFVYVVGARADCLKAIRWVHKCIPVLLSCFET